MGLQHKLLLGVAPKDGSSGLAATKGADSGSSSSSASCGCRGGKQPQQQQRNAADCKRCGGGGGSRYLYRMVATVADISERVRKRCVFVVCRLWRKIPGVQSRKKFKFPLPLIISSSRRATHVTPTTTATV